MHATGLEDLPFGFPEESFKHVILEHMKVLFGNSSCVWKLAILFYVGYLVCRPKQLWILVLAKIK